MDSVKDIIRNRRIELELTMKEVADAVGVSEATVCRWESGEIENMKRDKIVALSDVLRLPPTVIMGLEEEPQGYYFDPETARYANELKENPGMRLLFDASRDMPPEDILKTLDFINANLKKKY